jgi:hypothetical protein
VCVGKDRLDAKREVKEETEMAKVLPGFVPGCRLGSSVMESVTSRHRAKLPLPSTRLERPVAAARGDHVPEVLRLLLLRRRPRWQQPSSVRATHSVSELSWMCLLPM